MTTMNETTGATPGFTAHEAADTLSKLEDYEETLNGRAGALTWMLFGLAAAGIFATYTVAVPYLNVVGSQWVLSILWVPWIAGAGLATNALWGMLAVAVPKREHNGRGILLITLAGVGIFYVLMALVFGLSNLAGFFLGPAGWAIVIGTFTAVLAVFQSVHFCSPNLRVPFVTAGAALVLLGILLAWSEIAATLAGLVISGAVLVAYFAAALIVYHRG